MYVFAVATRYLRSRPMSWVASVIIVLIVVIYLLIISVMEGFKKHYMVKLRSIMAHMTVRVGNVPWGIVRPEQWSEKLLEVEGIRGVTISTETPAIAIFDRGRTVGTLRGIDLERELAHGKLNTILDPKDIKEFGEHKLGLKTMAGCIVGGAWRETFELKKGGQATFMFTNEDGDPRAIAFYIIGFFQGKNRYLENAAYVDQKLLAQEMKMPGTAKTLSLWVEGDPDRPDLSDIRDTVNELMKKTLSDDPYVQTQNEAVPDQKPMEDMLVVETWREKDQNFYHAITRENQIMRFIMMIFLLFVVIIIFLILGRMVAEKIRDIGALRAMGATPNGIRFCFLLQGFIIAAIGIAIGIPLALLLVGNVNEIEAMLRIEVFPKGSFLIDHIPTNLKWSDVLLISALSLASGLLGALVPAWHASTINPVECLRHE